MKTLTVAAIAIMTAVLSIPAYSQGTSAGRGLQPREEPKVDPGKKKAEDKAYNDALSRLPSEKEYDPWQGVREKKPVPPKKTGR